MFMVIKMENKITTYNEKETIEIAQNLESEKFPNMVICLIGDLGSGKTVFTKGFAQALGIEENVTSPTFNVIKEYTSGETPLYHMDVYKLDDDSKLLVIFTEDNKISNIKVMNKTSNIIDKIKDEVLDK